MARRVIIIMDHNLRKLRLEKDGHECQLSKLFGISRLSGKPCTKDLEVHHVRYPKKEGEQEAICDLITVCVRCHDILTDAIRRERYSTRDPQLNEHPGRVMTTDNRERRTRNEHIELQDCRNFPTVDAQWSTGRSSKRVDSEDKGDFRQEKESDC